MTFQRFEDLEIWQNARSICIKIRGLENNSNLGKDFSIKDQILRSSGSCMDNIAEGFERDGNKEFINFLIISKGSIGETRSQVYRSFDAGHFNEETFNDILNDCFTLSKKLSGFINFLKKSDFTGRLRTNQEKS